MDGKIELARAEPALQAEQLDALIELWLEECEQRLSPETGTAEGYRAKIRYFRAWWASEGAHREWRLTQQSLQEFERQLRSVRSIRTGEALALNSRHDVLRRLRQALRWAWQRGYVVGIDYSQWVPAAIGDPPQRRALSIRELSRLLKATSRSQQPTRDGAIVALLIGTGIRRAECAGLDIPDLKFDGDGSGTAHVRQTKRVRGRGRGRVVAFDTATGRRLLAWLYATDRQVGPLFIGAAGRLSNQSVYRVVRRAAERAGLESSCTPHDLRRAFITHWRRTQSTEATDHLLHLQVGHADDSMTRRYSLQEIEDVRRALTSPMSLISEVSLPFEGRDTD